MQFYVNIAKYTKDQGIGCMHVKINIYFTITNLYWVGIFSRQGHIIKVSTTGDMDGRKRKDNDDLTWGKDKDKDNDKKLRWDHLVVAGLHVHLSGSWIQCVPVCAHFNE